jgi:aminoglycoside 3-N-acetyltransferase
LIGGPRPEPFTRGGLAADLRALGVAAGDVVMVHAGLRSVGRVVGGVNAVVYALLDAVAAAGTVVAYADWETGVDDWDDRSIDDAIPVFDKRIARASRDHGILAETLRTWPGGVRSDHPDASVVAIGPHAERLCADHPLQYGYGERSPFAKLVALPAKILMLGAPLDTITLVHHAEHVARMPGKRIVRYRRKLLRDGAPAWVEIEEFDTSLGAVDGLPDEYIEHIAEEYLANGNGTRGLVGAAESVLLDAAGLHRFAVCWLEEWAAQRGAAGGAGGRAGGG